ncbi:ferredoxin--NADP+ reductase [Strigomonas culicis]|uniref:Ferredoxin--NADP+ reductase n=1 Tax=Strigomonas culicis TaxID=28005 RepID=S9TRW6_9TRYP|nr:ferredoxin--NADP+ reductase [Strigomonas culicis]|eukprot:EPY19339.1 ferredoxin--NADP+ reductase [Strigomonas culicis]
MDVTRVLSGDYKYFAPTDMNAVAVTVGVDPFDLAAALERPAANARAHRRLMELVHQHTITPEALGEEYRVGAATVAGERLHPAEAPPPADPQPTPARGPCAVRFRYHLRPIRFLPSPHRKNFVGAVLYERMDLPEDAPEAARYVVQPCDVVLKSIGYRSDPIVGVPFDHGHGIIPNVRGRVVGMPRVYCSGWVRNGAKGVILHSVVDAQDTVNSILEDVASGALPADGAGMSGKYGLVDYFVEKQLQPVSVAGLERIFYVEKERGVDLGKRLEKVDSVRDMLDLALGGDVGRRTHERVRSFTASRPEAMLYLKELLDDDTDLAPLARELAKDLPYKLAAQHPPGRIGPGQL